MKSLTDEPVAGIANTQEQKWQNDLLQLNGSEHSDVIREKVEKYEADLHLTHVKYVDEDGNDFLSE